MMKRLLILASVLLTTAAVVCVKATVGMSIATVRMEPNNLFRNMKILPDK